jgi:hypothetical protein
MEAQLDEEGFKKFLALLHPDPSRAAEEYLLLRLRITKYFEFNPCGFADECADVVLERLAKRAVEVGDVRDISKFALGTGRVYYLEVRRKQARMKKAMEDLLRQWDLSDNGCPVEIRHDCLQRCLAEVRDGDVILRYFQAAHGAKGELRACIENCIDRKTMR